MPEPAEFLWLGGRAAQIFGSDLRTEYSVRSRRRIWRSSPPLSAPYTPTLDRYPGSFSVFRPVNHFVKSNGSEMRRGARCSAFCKRSKVAPCEDSERGSLDAGRRVKLGHGICKGHACSRDICEPGLFGSEYGRSFDDLRIPVYTEYYQDQVVMVDRISIVAFGAGGWLVVDF